ncbi:MAG: phosphatase PAP2 family protein [Bacteroidales bacterium]|jgi:undecaprenyl-diphosphatase|nr:phosphatase PAP2 family protein [Bacteroidales bacterium]MCI1786330.1 phosphatase PAP2 family protein [Bacteroidales bacterium]
MTDFLHNADQALTLLINESHNGFTDSVMPLLSNKYVWVPIYAVTIFMLIKRLGWKKGLIIMTSIILTVTLCDQTADFFKNMIDRLRPCYNTKMLTAGLNILEGRGGYFGFYSGHATNAFGFAACSIMGFRTDKFHTYNAYRTLIYIWAALVAMSRVFVGKHYFGDILVGTAIGLLIGYGIGILTRILIKRYIEVPVQTNL